MRSLLVFATCSILLLWAFRSAILAAVHVWSTSGTYGHGFLVFPIILFLFWRLRHHLAKLQPKAAPWALVLVAGAILCWIIGDLTNLQVVEQLAFVALWQSLFLLLFGWRVTRASLFPLAYLYLAVPLGLSLIPALQHTTAQIVVRLLRLSGVPVFLEGFQIEIPTASFLVAEACSGIRYLIVCIALGILAAHLFFRSWPRRALFVALAMLVPIFANGIRAYGIVMFARYGYADLAHNFDHVIYGFIFLSVVTLSLLGLGALLRESRQMPHFGVPHRTASLPVAGRVETTTTGSLAQVLCAVVALVLVFSVQAWTSQAKAPPANLVVSLRGPAGDPPWMPDGGAPVWSPTFQGTDAKLQQSYRLGEKRVDLFVGYYVYERDGAKAVSGLNTMTGGKDGKILSSRQLKLQIAGIALPINELIILHSGRPFLVWYWYRIGGENTNSPLVEKLLQFKAVATGSERAAAVIAVSTELSENAEETAALLRAFLQQGFDGSGALFQVEPSSAAAAMSELQPAQDPAGGGGNP
ncbi:MAG TPA: exosortase A [Bradyrhizobium sp.]|nr:exosortase A [Bradyrhizobium sp.]